MRCWVIWCPRWGTTTWVKWDNHCALKFAQKNDKLCITCGWTFFHKTIAARILILVFKGIVHNTFKRWAWQLKFICLLDKQNQCFSPWFLGPCCPLRVCPQALQLRHCSVFTVDTNYANRWGSHFAVANTPPRKFFHQNSIVYAGC